MQGRCRGPSRPPQTAATYWHAAVPPLAKCQPAQVSAKGIAVTAGPKPPSSNIAARGVQAKAAPAALRAVAPPPTKLGAGGVQAKPALATPRAVAPRPPSSD